MPHACLNRYLHKLRIASSKPVLRDTNVVFKTGSDCSAVSCEHPIHHLSLMSSYAGCRFPASGSSWESLAHGGVSMDDSGCWQRVSLQECCEPAPVAPTPAIPPRQPFQPSK